MSKLFYALTIPGLEALAFEEISTQMNAELVKLGRGLVLFRTSSDPRRLLDLRTVEDVYVLLVHIKHVGVGGEPLRVLHSATKQAPFEEAWSVWRKLHQGNRAKTWRVVSQMSGKFSFRRIDAGDTVRTALQRTLPRGIRLVKDEAESEFWLLAQDRELILGLRLSDASMRHRTYKRQHLPASLRPTVAATMALMSKPAETDRVLDPLCGVGTLLVERALLSPVAEVRGGDIREEAVGLARRNLASAHVPGKIQLWDARELPLDPGSYTHVITNLPFGKQIGTTEDNQHLYRDVLREFKRVLTSDGRLIALTSEDRLLSRVLQEQNWRVESKKTLTLLGQDASIFVAKQRG
jgi:23S rRNA G2445 N2-methylase RlmL